MGDPVRPPESFEDSDRGPDRGPARGAPRWKVAAAIIIAIALLGLIVFLHLSGAIGPGAH